MKNIVALILIVVTIPISAQEKLAANYIDLGMCSNISTESINNNKLNTFLSDLNYFKSVNTINITSLGLSIRQTGGQSMFKLGFHSGRSKSNASKNNTTLNLYGIDIDYLYDFTKADKWLIAPVLGLNINSYHLNTVSQNSISLLSDKNLVEDFQIENKFISNIGLEIDRQIKVYFLNVYLGLKGYYNIDFSNSKWRTSKSEHLNNIPSIDFSGYAISFNVRIEFNWSKILSKQNK